MVKSCGHFFAGQQGEDLDCGSAWTSSSVFCHPSGSDFLLLDEQIHVLVLPGWKGN